MRTVTVLASILLLSSIAVADTMTATVEQAIPYTTEGVWGPKPGHVSVFSAIAVNGDVLYAYNETRPSDQLLKIDILIGDVQPIPVQVKGNVMKMAFYQGALYILTETTSRPDWLHVWRLTNETTGACERFEVRATTDIGTISRPADAVNALRSKPEYADLRTQMDKGNVDLDTRMEVFGRTLLNVAGGNLVLTDRGTGETLTLFRNGQFEPTELQAVSLLEDVLMEGAPKVDGPHVAESINGSVRLGCVGGTVVVEQSGRLADSFTYANRGEGVRPILCALPYVPAIGDNGRAIVWEVTTGADGVTIRRWQ